MTTIETGRKGENLVEDYLIKKGYEIMSKNYYFGNYEIDLIALKNKILCVIEVKTRKSNTIVSGAIAVNKTKQKNLISAIRGYIKSNSHVIFEEIRFDIAEVIKNGNKEELIYTEDAFNVPLNF